MIRALAIAFVLALPGAAAVAGKQAGFFGERHWTAVREFYNEQMRAGICPIGFAKKDDGCEPPAQARKWALGKPLPIQAIMSPLRPITALANAAPSTTRHFRIK